MIKKILAVLVVVVVVVLIVAAMQPDGFTVARSATIAAPPAVVFAQVNDLQKWQAWSPWAKLDPAAKMTFEGPAGGAGASYTWSGNSKVGEGTMTITESRPDELVRFKLDFRKPFAATNSAEFLFKPEGGQTVVTWSMSGSRNLMFKAVGLFRSCDKMIGPDFEKGLASLKDVAEGAAKH